MRLICPVCEKELFFEAVSCACAQGHRFDMARQGYVNLLTVQQKHSLNPGDTREQVASRREFLSAGFYQPIADALEKAALELEISGPILDVGCGEGYYSARLAQSLQTKLVGVDISKEAVRRAAGTYKNARWLCASAAKLPIANEQAGVITSLFAVTFPQEFARVLKPGGYILQVLAAQDHLLGLKSVIYPELKLKEKDSVPTLPGFTLMDSRRLQFSFTVEGVQVLNLLAMTPHVYRISREGAQRLEQIQSLTDRASCVLNIYRRS